MKFCYILIFEKFFNIYVIKIYEDFQEIFVEIGYKRYIIKVLRSFVKFLRNCGIIICDQYFDLKEIIWVKLIYLRKVNVLDVQIREVLKYYE